jgi:CRP/FNR family transcriptional regulator, anaerobic regulatory protein
MDSREARVINKYQESELLAAYPVLRALPPALWRSVVFNGQGIAAAVNTLAFEEGDSCHSYLMVTSGGIRVIKPTSLGRELLLYRVMRGDDCILTVSCLLGACSYQARGIVEADLAGVSISREVFLQLVEQSPEFRINIFHMFGERVTRLMELIDAVAFRRLDQRLAALLLLHGPVIAATHQSLADDLGSVREVVSRILGNFQAQNILRLDRGQIFVLDREALRQRVHRSSSVT